MRNYLMNYKINDIQVFSDAKITKNSKNILSSKNKKDIFPQSSKYLTIIFNSHKTRFRVARFVKYVSIMLKQPKCRFHSLFKLSSSVHLICIQTFYIRNCPFPRAPSPRSTPHHPSTEPTTLLFHIFHKIFTPLLSLRGKR